MAHSSIPQCASLIVDIHFMQPEFVKCKKRSADFRRIILPTFLAGGVLFVIWALLLAASLTKDARGAESPACHLATQSDCANSSGSTPALVTGWAAADFFTNYGRYMPRVHCLAGANGQPDWPWIIALMVLSAGVIVGYARIYVFWCRAYVAEDERDRNDKLMHLAQIFLWCAVSGYAASLLMFVWPAYRLVAVCLFILNIWTWRFAMRLDAFRVSFSAKRFRRLAKSDALTGLYNGAAIRSRISVAIKRATAHPDRFVGLQYLDFDRFKQINDSLGHDAGDELIRLISERLRAFCDSRGERENETWCAGRVGGDEFVLLGEGLSSADKLNEAAEELLAAADRPFDLHGQCVFISASVGTRLVEPGAQSSRMIREADIAMYAAKARGRACVVAFDEAMQARVVRRMHLEADLRSAIEQGTIKIVYQPVVRLNPPQVVGAEALARWDHPEYGEVSPSEFVSIAEECGLIEKLGEHILKGACRQLTQWQRDSGGRGISISINVSRFQLDRDVLPVQIEAAISQSGVSPESVRIELTESALHHDIDKSLHTLRALRKLGVKTDVDGFGMGHSSLGCLHQFPVDRVKIQQTFIQSAMEQRSYAAVLHAILALANNLNIEVVAQGIETSEQVAMLLSMDCALGQGFYFGHPMSANQFAGVLNTGNHPIEADRPLDISIS